MIIRSIPEIKPILKYPGSKWSMAEWVASFFPDHTHYFSGFSGGLSESVVAA